MWHPGLGLIPEEALVHLFSPRTYKVPLVVYSNDDARNLWAKMNVDFSYCLLKNGTAYTEVISPTAEQVNAATVTYLGGHVYLVDDAEAAALRAAGYTVTDVADRFPYALPFRIPFTL